MHPDHLHYVHKKFIWNRHTKISKRKKRLPRNFQNAQQPVAQLWKIEWANQAVKSPCPKQAKRETNIEFSKHNTPLDQCWQHIPKNLDCKITCCWLSQLYSVAIPMRKYQITHELEYWIDCKPNWPVGENSCEHFCRWNEKLYPTEIGYIMIRNDKGNRKSVSKWWFKKGVDESTCSFCVVLHPGS